MSLVTSIDDQPIVIPIAALSPEGFRCWCASAEFPQQAKITPVDDGILIEGTAAETTGLDFRFRIPQSASTVAGFCNWTISDEFPDRGRISFLQQEIVIDMSPEETDAHIFVKDEITTVLRPLVRQLRLGQFFGDGLKLRNDETGLVTVPDAQFASGETLQTGRLVLRTRRGQDREHTEAAGTPDWVLEVVSRSSVKKDKHRLRELYHRAGIAEYWLIDALGAEIDFQILIHQPDGYVPAPVSDGWIHSPVFGRRFKLDRRDNEWGLWEYTLQVAE